MRKLPQFDTKLPHPTPADPTDPPRSKTAALGFGNMHCPKGTAEGGR